MSSEAGPNTPLHQLRKLPSVDELLRNPVIGSLIAEFPRGEILNAIRTVLEHRRACIRAGQPGSTEPGELGLAIRELLHTRAQPSLRRVINATGIVLHTGLGRAPLAAEALDALVQAAAGYSSLEIDLETGQRGDRQVHCGGLLCELTGAEDALVVNNNAAATWLALNALACERDVIISRGQLVEIGGSYRMPDIMAAAGCRMVEVGTTNRTRVDDYVRALTADTAVLLHVHTSNYRIEGFVASVAVEELAELARRSTPRGMIVVDDLGSGLLDQPPSAADVSAHVDGPVRVAEPALLWDEPTVRASLAAGADVVLFSGDKLLGGPQSGIAIGRRELLNRMRSNPLMRALRPDKLTLTALEATLRLYRLPDVFERIPTLRLLTASMSHMEPIASRLAEQITIAAPGVVVSCRPDRSFAGGGALPTLALPTWVVAVKHPACGAAELARGLRQRELPIAARIHADTLIFDCRTLLAGEADYIPAALADVLRDQG
jgi:L-seryl-tRNA(Ser) seleniumtransferase